MNDQPTYQDNNAFLYQVFLVRIWKDGVLALWRCSAQSVQTGEVMRFASLNELFSFLESQTDDASENDFGTK